MRSNSMVYSDLKSPIVRVPNSRAQAGKEHLIHPGSSCKGERPPPKNPRELAGDPSGSKAALMLDTGAQDAGDAPFRTCGLSCSRPTRRGGAGPVGDGSRPPRPAVAHG